MIRFTICTVILSIVSSLIVADDPCLFEISGKGVIDLSSIGNTNGTAAFVDIIPSGPTNYKYSYNPCKPFSEGDACRNIAACQVSMDGLYQFPLGSQNSAKWSPGDAGSNPTVSYTAWPKLTVVELICSEKFPGDLVFIIEDPVAVYQLQLHSRCACPGGCESTTASRSNYLTPNAIFVIIIVALAAWCMTTYHQ